VSNALRGVGRIAPATRERVCAAAQEAGYRRNPIVGTLMSELRRSHHRAFSGVIAAIDLCESDHWPHGAFPREILRGAVSRAEELGFKIELFIVNRDGLTVQRLDSILKARGIYGIILLPSWHQPDLSALDWPRYSAVYADYSSTRPRLHSVCCDQHRAMLSALSRLAARGYRRPGLFLDAGRDDRIHFRWSAAFHVFQQNCRGLEVVPPHFVAEFNVKSFAGWFRRCQPDVVLSHFSETISFMEACGAKVPRTHGFVALNRHTMTRLCAAIDQQPREIGARCIERVTAQLQCNERGMPRWPSVMSIPARWVEGPTICPPLGAGKSASAEPFMDLADEPQGPDGRGEADAPSPEEAGQRAAT